MALFGFIKTFVQQEIQKKEDKLLTKLGIKKKPEIIFNVGEGLDENKKKIAEKTVRKIDPYVSLPELNPIQASEILGSYVSQEQLKKRGIQPKTNIDKSLALEAIKSASTPAFGTVDAGTGGLGGFMKKRIKTPPTTKSVETLKNTITPLKQSPQFPSQVPQDVSSFYNIDKLNIDNKAKGLVKEEINKSGDYLNRTVGSRLTNKEVLDTASSTSRVVNRVISREQTKNKIASSLRLRQEIAKVAQDGKVNEDFIRLWIKDKSIGEDIARQLQARKIKADPNETGFIDIVLQSIYKVNKNADDIAREAQNVDFNNIRQVTEFYRKFVKPKTSEWIDLLRYNSMLTSPNTHMVNIISNFQGTGLITPIEKTITGLVDATRSALTGKPREYAIGEGIAFSKGYFGNLGNATKRFTDVMKGKDVVSHPDMRQIPLTTGGVKQKIEKTLNFPLRLLDAMDKFFITATESGLENASKYKARQGITFQGERATQEAMRRTFRGGSEKQGYVLNAVDSFTNLIMSARESQNPILSTIAKFTLPFVRTPTEIFKQGIEYSPLGLSTLAGASNKTEQISKMILGTGSALGVATLLGQDKLTWAEPTNPKEKNDFRASGRQPYSVKIGDKWVSYSKLHPALAFNFALVSSIDDSLKKKKLSESEADSIMKSFAKYANFIADQSYLKNIGDFVSGIKGDGFSKLVSNYPQQLIPFRSMLSWIERLIDPYQRQIDYNGTELDKQMQYFMMQIPGLAQTLPERRSSLGTPIKNENRLLNSLSPSRVTNEVPAFESLYQIRQNKSKIDRIKQDLKEQIKSKLESKMR